MTELYYWFTPQAQEDLQFADMGFPHKGGIMKIWTKIRLRLIIDLVGYSVILLPGMMTEFFFDHPWLILLFPIRVIKALQSDYYYYHQIFENMGPLSFLLEGFEFAVYSRSDSWREEEAEIWARDQWKANR